MISDKKYYVTTPIYYVNGSPHIGHAYTSVISDVIARWKRLNGFKTMFVTGTDEHGQKIEESAKKNGIKTMDFVNDVSKKFQNLIKTLNISSNSFVRTTQCSHRKAVLAIWNKLLESGNIYKGKYSSWYSITDEAFYHNGELIDGKAPTGSKVELIEEVNYFFRLSQWQEKLLEFYRKNPSFIKPKARYNEVISFVENGLSDLSISRESVKWGIKTPGDDSQTVYVWLDALTSYLSAIGYPEDKYKEFWPCNVHVIGKDILRFHAVYWPAFLMAAKIQMPKHIVSHGWWTNEGEKMSKSLGNVIDPTDIVERFGLDQFRYFLVKEITLANDGNFCEGALKSRINSELRNKLGNLVQRVLVFTSKHYDSLTPTITSNLPSEFDSLTKNKACLTNSEGADSSVKYKKPVRIIDQIYSQDILIKCERLRSSIDQCMEEFKIKAALEHIFEIVQDANAFIDLKAPWSMNSKTRDAVIYTLLEVIRYVGIALSPFMPHTSSKILDLLSIDQNFRCANALSRDFAMEEKKKLALPKVLFT